MIFSKNYYIYQAQAVQLKYHLDHINLGPQKGKIHATNC